jgi:iron complex transport system ATP-binding protein
MNTSTTTPILSCRKLAVGYNDKTVLADLNLSFAPGQFVSLLGPNGAGKTTLLRTLSRHLTPLYGSIAIQGRPLEEISPMELARFMAVVLTEKVTPPLFTVFEFVALGRYPHTDFLGRMAPHDYETVEKALASVNAKDLARRAFSDLSDGERQKALVARALAQEPRLLLLDEPTLHLDLKHRMEVMTILRNLCHSQGITVVASLHDVDVAAKVSDQVALIKKGGMTAWGIPETVLSGPVVADLYDFSDARFSTRLGGIEFSGNDRQGRVFVLAGAGAGALVYRMLAKRGFGISTGLLYTNDVDYYVARSLGADCITQPPMTVVDKKALARAAKQMDACALVIDCGPNDDDGPMSQGNLELLQTALKKGKSVLSLRKTKDKETAPSADELSGDGWISCHDAGDLVEALDRRVSVKDVRDAISNPSVLNPSISKQTGTAKETITGDQFQVRP